MGVIRNLLLGFKGPNEFSNIAFKVRSKRFKPEDLNVSCKGKKYLITGANGSIGSVVATEIAKRHGEVHMLCRNRQTANLLKSNILKKTGNKDVHVHNIDLSESSKVYSFAKNFAKSHSKLEALIHVAGTRPSQHVMNKEGLEYTFAVNTLAPHILTRLLSPLLSQSFKGRIILTSSFSMYLSSLNASDPQLQKIPFNPKILYTHTKRQLVDLAGHYGEELVDMFTASCSPGWVASPFTSKLDVQDRYRDMWRTPEEGADCLLWLAISDAALLHPNGCFFQDRQPYAKHLFLVWTSITSKRSRHKFVSYMDNILEKLSNQK